MNKYSESLRGYGHKIHKRNKFKCQYCGYDGRSFLNWLQLTVEHIIPYSQGGSEDEKNKTTVCHWCNSTTSRIKTKGLSRKKIIAKKKKLVRKRQAEFKEFWKANVKKKGTASL